MRRLLLVLVLSACLLATSLVARPQTASAFVEPHCDGSTYFLGFPTWYRYLDVGGDNCDVTGPTVTRDDGTVGIDWQKASGYIALAIVEILLRIAALAAVAYVMYGGFRYITSQGEPDSAKSARQTIINGLIGLVISLVATGAVAFTANQLTKGGGSATTEADCPVGQVCAR